MKTLWRKNFDIRRTDYNLPYESLIGFQTMLAKTIGVNPIKEVVWVFRNGDCEGCYIPVAQLRRAVERTLKKILEDPASIDRVHKKATALNWQLFSEAQKVRKLDFDKMSSKQILIVHHRLYKIIHTSHMWATATTWFVDSDGEDFSKHLMRIVEKRLQAKGTPFAKGVPFDPASIFSILTTPKEKSFSQKEEEESLKLLVEFRRDAKIRHWFVSHTTEELARTLGTLPSAIRRKILAHHQKWLWLPYTYTGPAWGVDYFLEIWRGLLREDVDSRAKLTALKAKRESIQKHRVELVKKLKLTAYEKHLFDIAADIVWLKGFRKDTFYYAFYSLDLLLTEVARRAGLTLMQTKYLVPGDPLAKSLKLRHGEIPKALSGQDFSAITSDRIKFSIMHARTGKVRVLRGKEASRFLSKLKIEKVKAVKTSELKGTCACPGKAVGVVKIVNLPEDMPKMNAGDIMLAHTTFPALVPAMKKASAIVTEDGGITCHAAIVSRELQTPCVVGIKNLLSEFRDGDQVEVDANKGTVKKI